MMGMRRPRRPTLIVQVSMVALHREARDGAEQVGLGAERLDMLDRLADQDVGLEPRPLGPEQGHEGLLAGGAILADALAGFLLHALMVDQIVDDLEGETEIAGKAAKAGPGF